MSTPVVESIAQYLVDLVANITVANGYNYDLNPERPTCLSMTDALLQDLNVIITQGEPAEPEILSNNIRAWEQPFYLAAIVYEDSEVVDTKINKIRSDLEKALGIAATALDGDAKCCDGKADRIRINRPQFLEYEQFTGVVVVITVGYSVAANVPYSTT